MFGPGWGEGCVGCSFLCDGIDGALPHLHAHDVSLVAIARTPLAELTPFKERMGWKFPWVSSHDSDFNYDYHVSFTPEQMASGRGFYNFAEDILEIDELSGTSVFVLNAQGEIFHTYSAYARGGEQLLMAYHYLEMTPGGRNEHGPRGNLSDWVRHHDRRQGGMPSAVPGFFWRQGFDGGPGTRICAPTARWRDGVPTSIARPTRKQPSMPPRRARPVLAL